MPKKKQTIEEILKDAPVKTKEEMMEDITNRINEATQFRAETNEMMIDLIAMSLLPEQYRDENFEALEKDRINLTIQRMIMKKEIDDALNEAKELNK